MPASSHAPTLRFSQLAAALAHAVRNPLAGARARVEGIRGIVVNNSRVENACAEAARCLDRVEEAVAAIIELANPPHARATAVELDIFVKRYRGAIVRKAEENGCSLSFHFENARAAADAELLYRSIGLAAAYLYHRGARRVEARAIRSGNFVHIQIERVDAAPERDFPGDGLELARAQVLLGSFGANLQINREESGRKYISIILNGAPAEAELS